MDVRALSRGRGVVVAVVVAVLLLVLGSCMLRDTRTPGRAVVDDFVAALNNRDARQAASLTSNPPAARDVLDRMFEGLEAGHGEYDIAQFVELNDDSGFFTLGSDWQFGEGQSWTFQSDGGVRRLGVGWRISWDPAVLAPQLSNSGTVRYVRTDAAPPRVNDAGGAPLLEEQTVNAVVLDPTSMPDPAASTTRLAEVLAPVAPVITAQVMQDSMASQPGRRVTAVKLRDQDYQFLADDITAIPGVQVQSAPTLVSVDRRISTPLSDGLRGAWQAARDETAGWAVTVSDTNGSSNRLAGFQGPPPPDLTATLESSVQLAAEESVVLAGAPAALVAIRPSTGGVVALDVNNYAMEQGPMAERGMFPAPDVVEPVRQAVAQSRGVDASQVSPDEVTTTLHQLGLGLDYTVPGGWEFDTVATGDDAEGVVRFSGGADGPKVSPMGAAMLAASVAHGSAVVPSIVAGQPAAVADAPGESVPQSVIDSLRRQMGDMVATGPASLLDVHPGTAGIAAASGDDRWFYGTSGDLAFAVYVANADTGERALQIADKFLQEIASPSNPPLGS